MSRTVRRFAFLTLLALGLLVALPSASAAAVDSMLRVVHASPDAPPVDVFVDGQKAITNLKFTEATTYVMLPAGSHKVQVFATGTGPAGKAVIDAALDLKAGQAYTVAAVNLLAKIEPLVITDDMTAPAAGKAHLRVVHASPDAPAVDVAVKGGPVPFKNAPFKAATPYTPVDAGTYTFEIRPTGTTTAVLTTDPTPLAAGRLYTIFAMGQVGNNTLKAVAFADNAAPGSTPAAGGGGMARSGPGGLQLAALGLLVLLAAAVGTRIARPFLARSR